MKEEKGGMRLLSVSALYRAVVLTWLLRGGNGFFDEDGKRIEALYTLTINLSDGQEKVFRIYDEKQEVADAVDEFVRLQSLGREHQERMYGHTQAGKLWQSSPRPRRNLSAKRASVA